MWHRSSLHSNASCSTLGNLGKLSQYTEIHAMYYVANADYIKLTWCNQFCCNSTFISDELLYSHLCRNSFQAALPLSERNLVRERMKPFLWDDFQLPLDHAFPFCMLLPHSFSSWATIKSACSLWTTDHHTSSPKSRLSRAPNKIGLPDPFDFSSDPRISSVHCFFCSSPVLHSMGC